MNILDGINNFLLLVNENWTAILVCIGLAIGLFKKIKDFIGKTDKEKIEIAKIHIRESVLKMITDAELNFEEWNKAGSIKRSQVIQKIFADYPILEKVVDQDELIKWIDDVIDESLVTLRDIVSQNKKEELQNN